MQINILNDIEDLFNEHYEALCYHAFKLVRDKDVAEDIVQDVFVKVWKNKDKIQITISVKSYLYKSTTNTALNYLERSKKMQSDSESELENYSSGLASPLSHLEAKELQNRIAITIEKLPPKCKVIFLLSRDEGYKYHEIAKELNISIKTVENQMSIALEKMRDGLKNYIL